MKKYIYKNVLILLTGLFITQHLNAQLDTTGVHHYDFVKKPGVAFLNVTAVNVFVNRFDAHINGGGQYWAKVNPDTWKANLEHGLEWDWNAFSTNWFAHPYHGSLYFNSARSMGLSFWESAPYTFGGSLMWEYFGETHPPSGNDLVNTTLGGIYLGEMFHRISDNLLSKNVTGYSRTWRVILATMMNPMRALNSWVFGRPRNKTPRYNNNYGDSPLKMHFAVGGNFLVKNLNLDRQRTGPYLEFGMLYGDPFEEEDFFEPMEFFSVYSWMRFVNNDDRSLPFLNVYAYGNLWASNVHASEKATHTFGAFLHYDYLHNEVIENGAIGFSAGLLSNFKTGNKWDLMTAIHFGPAALGGVDSEIVGQFTDDPESRREYVLGPGYIAKADFTADHPKWGSFSARGAYYKIFIYSGPEGNERVRFFVLKYGYPIFKQFSLGINYTGYFRRVQYNDYVDYQDLKRRMYEFKTFVSMNF